MSKEKLIRIINLYENTREIYQAVNKLEDIPVFRSNRTALADSLNYIVYENFNLPELIICLYDLPEDNSKNYSQFMGPVEYKEENFEGMVCHDWLNDICLNWLSGDLTTQKLAEELVEYIEHHKNLEKGN